MNARILAILSLTLNLALGAGIWRVSRPVDGSASVESSSSSPRSDAHLMRVKTNVTQVEVTHTNAAMAFRWEQVQSADLTNYVAGLRRIDCPEATIRDIIRGELAEQYVAQRRVVLEPWQRRYWDLAVHGFERAHEEMRKELEPVRRQTLGRLGELLGGAAADAEEETEPELEGTTWQDSKLDFLSEEKRQQVTALQEKHTVSIEASAQEYPLPADRKAKIKELTAQRLEAIRAVLTPEEFEEYRLRTSRYASAGRRLGFDASEDELRAVTRVYEQFAGADDTASRKDPDYEVRRKQQQELKQQRDDAVKAQLGEERYAEFKRAQDGGFERLMEVTERYGLTRETAIASYDIQNTARTSAAQVRNNRALTEEQRRELLQALQRETRAQLEQTLGASATRTYEKYAGQWLQGMGR